jgi:hypothetical protein
MLRLVGKPDSVVSFDEAQSLAQAKDALQAEALELATWFGENAYSKFLSQYGCRPDPSQAATIGQLMGMRVKASDETMQPRLTSAQRTAIKAKRDQRRGRLRYRRQVSRLLEAIANLQANVDSAADVIGYVHPQFEAPIISERLDSAVEWLNRFAEEWNRRENRPNEQI